ncbi:hypothetical protein [Streptomyces milbemycinicus]|uniref:hypothetical protein n=1 Tax=Streptomyces milbemycinicus TaxID=476552 RepID=UPI0033C70D4A
MLSPTIEQFLDHPEHDAPEGDAAEGDLLAEDWNEQLDVAVRVHLLDRWLSEDAPDAPMVLTDIRPEPNEPWMMRPDALVKTGLFPAVEHTSGTRRDPHACRAIAVAEAASAVERALLAGGSAPSRRVERLIADLRELILSQGREAVLVTVVDPVTGAVVPDETHVVLAWETEYDAALRISVVPRREREGRGEPRHAACSFAACPDGVRVPPEEHGVAEAKVRALCAGTVLAALLKCDGRAAFSVGWRPHGLDPEQAADLDEVREWWENTSWCEEYDDTFLGVYYDYGAGAWFGPPHLIPTQEQIDNIDSEGRDDYPARDCTTLGAPGESATSLWMLGDQLHSLHTAAFLTEVEAFRRACRHQCRETSDVSGPLVDALLDELLARPLERVGGPERRMLIWADADEDGGFWRTDDHSIDVYEDARRLLVVGPHEALYMIFNGDSGS